MLPAAALAHPLVHPHGLPAPIAIASAVAVAIALVARFAPGFAGPPPPSAVPPAFSWAGELGRPQAAGRVVGVLLVILAIGAGRLGSPHELDNIAPALVVGAGWPLLLLASVAVGPVWRWLDPWDGTARLLLPHDEGPAGDVRWAVAPALGWTWYLSAYPDTLDPRSVGAALGLYTMVTLAGCLALGRVAWLSRAEVFGLVFGWLALLRLGSLSRWSPPPGAEAVLGVIAGGLLFGPVRLSELWGELNAVPGALAYATAGAAGSGAVAALFLWALERRARRGGGRGSVVAAAVPAVAGIAVAVALSRNRLFTSVQLLPGMLLDPFGFAGGPLDRGVPLVTEPLGTTGLMVAQIAVLTAGHLAGAFVLARRTPVTARWPAAAALCGTATAGILVLAG